MIGATDWSGIAAVIVALGSTVPAIIAAVYAQRANAKVSTVNGSPSLGELATNVAAAVTTPDNLPTIGELAASNADTLDHVHAVVCNGKDDDDGSTS